MRALALLGIFILALVSPASARAPTARSRLLTPIPAPARFIPLFGQRIAYYEAGQGRTVILIPHIGWDSNMWGQNFAALARHAHVIAWDPLGQGRSDKPMIDYRMETWTDFLAEFMRLKHLDHAVIAGTGMGGALAVQMALDHPERVSGIAVAASSSGPGEHKGGSGRDAVLSSLAGSKELLLANMYDPSVVTEELVRARFEYRMSANDAYVIQRHMADHRPPYSRAELTRIGVPALFIWCRQDAITPPAWGQDFAAALPRASLTIIERCGHFPNLEQPEAFDAALAAFVATVVP